MDCDDTIVAQLLGGVQGRADLGGMVGVVVHDHCAVALAVDLKTAACPLEVQGSVGALLHGQAHRAADSTHGQCIVNVVAARHCQTDVAQLIGIPLLQIKFKEAGLVLLHVDSTIVGRIVNGKGAHAAVQGVHDIHGVLVVCIGKDHKMGHQGKALEGKLQLAHAAVIVQMVVIDVQHHGHIGGQLEEGLGELAGLDDDIIALAGLAVAADEGQLAADDCRGITACQLQCGGDHGSRGGLAVSAGNADAVLVQAAHIAQQNAALHSGDAIGSGSIQLHVVLGNGGRVDHQVNADHVVRSMTQADLHAHLPLRADDAAVQHIAAGDIISLGREDLDQRIHAAAAAADEVDLFHIIQQMHGIISNEHKQANLQ